MQSVSSSAPTPEAILEWLQKEMGYRSKSHVPSVDAIRKVCRGNMIPVWSFLMNRAKSEKTVESIRRNITVHGGGSDANPVKEESKVKGKRKEKAFGGESLSSAESREAALCEREAAAKEVERLRNVVRRQRKDLKARMLEVSREEAERKRMLDERASYRHKQVMLEAYDQQCDEAARIFAEYHKRLQVYVNQARNAQRSSLDSLSDLSSKVSTNSEREAVYSSVRGSKSADDVILVETARERSIRRACESLASHMVDRICNSFPAYEGNGIHSHPEVETAKLSFEYDGEISDEMRGVIMNCLSSPPLLLQAIAAHTLRLKTLISKEIERVDIRADAETLRYKYENNRVMEISSSDVSSPLSYQFNGNGKIPTDTNSKGSNNQLLERQKAHVQQFLGTEDALNKAAEARVLCQKLKNRLHGSADAVSSHSVVGGGTSQNVKNLRQLELDVWGKEREAAGLRASLNTLISEIQRLNKLSAERKEAEHSLKQKWKKIEEFDARRSELETIYTTLLKANMDAAAFWSQQPLAAREYAMTTIIPASEIVADISKNAKDFIEKEVTAFFQSPDNTLYMLPATPQALLESMGANGSTGPEAVAAAEKNAALLTARAGARDPSAIPSICRISAALQYPTGLEGSDASLASVLESLEFCLRLRGSEACVLEDLAKAINLVDIRQDLVESGRSLLSHAYHAQQEYERTTKHCLDLATEQDNTITEKWLPELKTAVLNAQASLEHCKHVWGLLEEWYEQPAATVVDWVTVDGQNVAAWHNHVKSSYCLLR
ncbi:unnamed protein product [Brassica rapa]|uniref:AUGMIN subunit 5 n=2 Tax=Brassica TaxID=3705 RepID=A0A3P5YMK7_BRACM|nr:unnamed protein product [Brassica napus]CAG7872500.1 unnamed protein product [Brassica rapa]VDC68349.1 unnamed protein product [Brassica rapa]